MQNSNNQSQSKVYGVTALYSVLLRFKSLNFVRLVSLFVWFCLEL